jgi:hypothetical protein
VLGCGLPGSPVMLHRPQITQETAHSSDEVYNDITFALESTCIMSPFKRFHLYFCAKPNLSMTIRIQQVQHEFWYCNVNKYMVDRQIYIFLLIYTRIQ